MAKYTEKLVSCIERLIEADLYTITEICRTMKISRNTFYEWKEKNPDFRKRIDLAEDRRDESLVKIARVSLKKKLEGYTVIEEHCTSIPAVSNPGIMIPKKKMVKTKYIGPDMRAIKYVLDKEEKKKERQRQQEPEHKPDIIYVPDQQTADGFMKLEKMLAGTEGKHFRLATEEERKVISDKL